MSSLGNILLCSFLATGLWAQTNPVTFFEAETIPDAGGLAMAADLNGDGYTDLVFYASGGLNLLLSDGKGGFQDPTLLPLTGSPGGLAAGDFNGDGITDLLIATGSSLLYLPGLGGGAFGTAVVVYSGYSGFVAAGDFNGDGKLDAATVGVTAGQTVISLLLGNGDGTFQLSTQLTGGKYSGHSLVAADFDGDGALDLLFSQGKSASYIVWGDGKGNLQRGPDVRVVGKSQFAVADVNGDGLPDLVVPDNGGVGVLLGNGDGTFRASWHHTTVGQMEAVVVADLNGDGKLDVAALTTLCDSLLLMYGNGDGTFTLGPEYLAGLAATNNLSTDLAVLLKPGGTQGIAVRDFISPISYYETSVNILRLNGNSLKSAKLIRTPDQPFGMLAGDFNNDGKLDLATSQSTGLAVMLGNGDGTFQPMVVSPGFPGSYPINVADLNNDGIPDVLVSGSTTPFGASLFLGNGDGTFRHFGTGPVLPTSPVGLADLNGDGILDAVTGPPLTVYLGKGDGTFGSPMPVANAVNLGWPFVFGDFNGDGKLDLAVNYVQGRTGYVLLGNGDGTFARPREIAGMGLPGATADLNGDGILDLVGYTNGTDALTVAVAVAFGRGDGTFAVKKTYPLQPYEFSYPASISIADWNGDGNLDIAAIPGQGYYTYFFLGNGHGAFTPQANGVLLFPFGLLATGDFDGDGLPDVASTGDAVWVIRNTSGN